MPKIINSPTNRMRRYTLSALIAWTMVAVCMAWVNWSWAQNNIFELIKSEARTNIEKDLLYRAWSASHGGVYVPVTETTQPNPYLNTPERDVTTDTNKFLTLINPAYMTRQVYEMQNASGVIRAHLTSLKPINPNNKADEWEAQSLKEFENGIIEVDVIEIIDGQPYLRLMRPFITTEDCLKCHAQQGYKVGDVRGGLSVSIPTSKYDAVAESTARAIILGYGLLWLLGLAGIYLASKDITKRLQDREEMTAAIQKSQKEYQTVLQTAMDGFLRMDSDGNILEVNDAYCKMCGYNREEILTMHISDFDVHEGRDEVKSHIEAIIANAAGRFETIHRRKDGSRFMVEVSAGKLEEGKLFAFLRDITAQKQAREDLRSSEEKFSKIFEYSPAMVTLTSLEDGTYLDANRKFLDTFGFERDEVIGKTSVGLGVIGEANRQQIVAQLISFGHFEDMETAFHKKDGSEIICLYNGEVIELNGKKLLLSLAQDITEQKRIQKSLQEHQAILLQAQKVANLGYYQMDVASGIWKSSDILDGIFGIEKDYPKSVQGWADVVHPDEREEMTAYFANEVLGKKQSFDREYRIVRIQDQQVRWVHGLGELQFNAEGEPTRMVGTIQDITEKKKAEDALRLSEEKFRKAFVISPDSININRLQDGEYISINEGFTEIMGYTPEECIGKTSIELNIWDRPEDRQKLVEGLLKHGEVNNLEARFRAKNGSIRYGLMSASVLELDGVKHIISITRDITERKQIEDENLEKTKELEALFKISSHLRTAKTAEEMFPVVLGQISQTFHSDANALILLDEDQIHFNYILGDGLLAANTGIQFEVEDSISGRIMQTLEAYVTPDFSDDPNRSSGIYSHANIGSTVIVPLQSEKEFIGTLLCARAKDSPAPPFTPAEVNLLTAIGEMVGNALRRASLYDDALLRLQRVQALRSIDAAINASMDSDITLRVLVNQILSLMQVDAAAVLLYSPITQTLEFATANGFRHKEIGNTSKKLNSDFVKDVITKRKLIKEPNLKTTKDTIYKETGEREGFASCYIVPMIAKGQVCGILEAYTRNPFKPNQEWLEFLESLAGQAAIAINNAQLFTDLQKSNLELSIAYDATIEGWSQALDLKDKETEGHTQRVTAWTIELAEIAGLRSAEIIHIRRGALLHDIGKMGIPDHILNKADKLTPEEWDIMQRHAQYAYDMLFPISFLRPAIDIPYCHHERWDGTGYPRGLKGEQIPFIARLFAVIDVWDAVTSDRPYRKAWSAERAIEHIKSESGKHFDPQIIDLFLQELNRFTRKK